MVPTFRTWCQTPYVVPTFRSAAALEREPGPDMRADARAEAPGNGGAETEQRSGHPDPCTHTPLEFLIAKALSLVVRRARVHEHAVAESRHAQRRGRRNAKLYRSGNERIADSASCAKTAEIARAAKQRFIERR